jgi:hypothetical protein
MFLRNMVCDYQDANAWYSVVREVGTKLSIGALSG